MRLILIIFFLALSLSACGQMRMIYDEAWLRAHFAQNEAGFDALALKAAEHPEVENVGFCPDQACLDALIMVDGYEFWTEDNLLFAPEMRRLNFRGYFFWWRTPEGGILIPNMGGASTETLWIDFYYVSLTGPSQYPACDGYELPADTLYGDCHIPLNETWVIRKSFINAPLAIQCDDAREACRQSTDTECIPEICRP